MMKDKKGCIKNRFRTRYWTVKKNEFSAVEWREFSDLPKKF